MTDPRLDALAAENLELRDALRRYTAHEFCECGCENCDECASDSVMRAYADGELSRPIPELVREWQRKEQAKGAVDAVERVADQIENQTNDMEPRSKTFWAEFVRLEAGEIRALRDGKESGNGKRHS